MIPKSKLLQEVGWLAPDGKYYPCDYDEPDRNSFFHLRKAREIVAAFYPDDYVDPNDYSSDADLQTLLIDKGWIRLDINDLWLRHKPTQAQVDTLFDLHELTYQRYLPTEKIRECLAWCGLKFLAKPDEDYWLLEASIPDSERTTPLPKLLKVPGRPR